METRQGPLDDIIGNLLSGEQPAAGNAGARASGQAQSGLDLGGLLGGLLGGQGGAGLGSLLGLLGGGGQAEIANALSQRTGLSPEIARVVVAFLVRKLSEGQGSAGAPKPRPASSKPRPSSTKPRPAAGKRRPKQSAESVPDLGSLLGGLLGGGAPTKQGLVTPGLAQELSQETGLDEETAARSLEQTMSVLAERSQGIVSDVAPSQRPTRRRKAPTAND